jgi:hypothetical protein
MKLKKEFDFLLQDEIIYSDGQGNAVKTKKLFVKAPSPKQKKYAYKLQQKFMQALKGNLADMQKNNSSSAAESKSDSEKLDGSAIITALLMSNVDINDFMDDLKCLLTSGSCLIDGKVELIELWFEQFGFDDQEKLLGEYIASFLLPSVMR